MASDRRPELTLAKSYPHDPPAHSFLYVNGATGEIVEPGGDGLEGAVRVGRHVVPVTQALAERGIAAERTAVIAHSSNASPARLARKFGNLAGDTVFPVIRAKLDDHDVVYSPHFPRTGSIPATLAASPATRVTVAITYLTAAQLARMHESNLGVDRTPVALAALVASGRRYPAATPAELLPRVRDPLARGRAVDDLLCDVIDEADYRKGCNERLRAFALAPSVERVEWIEPEWAASASKP